MLLASIALGAAVAAVSVSGDARCPTPEAVAPALEALLPPEGEPHALELRALEEDEGVALALRGADGAVLAERTLRSSAPCADRAAAVAAIVAAWEVDLRSRPRARVPLQRLEAPPPAPPAEKVPVELSAAAFISADLGGGAAALSVTLAPGAWRLSAGAFGSALRQVPLAPGTAAASRAAVELAFGRAFQGLGARFELQLHVLGGALALRGSGFEEDLSAVVPELGAGYSARATLGSGRLRPWLGLQAVVWPLKRTLVVGGASASASLPLVEAFIGAGLCFELTHG